MVMPLPKIPLRETNGTANGLYELEELPPRKFTVVTLMSSSTESGVDALLVPLER
jgi:hypothetical protein